MIEKFSVLREEAIKLGISVEGIEDTEEGAAKLADLIRAKISRGRAKFAVAVARPTSLEEWTDERR